jgi:hypothetical protein
VNSEQIRQSRSEYSLGFQERVLPQLLAGVRSPERFRAQGSGFRVQGAGFRVQCSGFRVQGSVFCVQGSGCRVQGSGFRVQGSGFEGLRGYTGYRLGD